MEAEITLIYEDELEAESVSKAVSPDNVKTPNGLIVETRREDTRVVTIIKYEGDRITTFLSTIDDLLESVQVAEKTILTAKMVE